LTTIMIGELTARLDAKRGMTSSFRPLPASRQLSVSKARARPKSAEQAK
jgi:hypothetical protein